MSRDQLQQAYDLIKSGDKAQAESMLQDIVVDAPDNIQAWWLLANAIDDPARQRATLKQVLRLKPDHAQAQALLQRLDDPPGDSFDDIYTDEPTEVAVPAGTVRVSKPKGQNRSCLMIVLILIFGTCGLCLLGTVLIGGSIGSIMMQVIDDPEVRAALAAVTEYASYVTLPANLDPQGVIEPGQTVTRTISGDRDHSWTFSGDSGQHFTIQVISPDGTADFLLFAYEPGGGLRGIEGSIGTGDRIRTMPLTLSPGGQYTIVVSAFGESGGDYELRLDRN